MQIYILFWNIEAITHYFVLQAASVKCYPAGDSDTGTYMLVAILFIIPGNPRSPDGPGGPGGPAGPGGPDAKLDMRTAVLRARIYTQHGHYKFIGDIIAFIVTSVANCKLNVAMQNVFECAMLPNSRVVIKVLMSDCGLCKLYQKKFNLNFTMLTISVWKNLHQNSISVIWNYLNSALTLMTSLIHNVFLNK